MKGTFFQKPHELHLEIEGASWRQGELLKGTLTVKNHGKEPVPLHQTRVILAEGELKKVRSKSPEAFELIASESGPKDKIAQPGSSETSTWNFQLTPDCPITDSSSSLFLLYGLGESLEGLGQIQLIVSPLDAIERISETLQTTFRFIRKSVKSNRGKVEIKFAPPSSQSFATLDHLLLSIWPEKDDLNLSFAFHLRKIEATASSLATTKHKKEVTRSLPRSVYLLPSGRFNHEPVETLIREALSQIEAKILF